MAENEQVEIAGGQETASLPEQSVEVPVVVEVPKAQGVVQENMPVQPPVVVNPLPANTTAVTDDNNNVASKDEVKEEFAGSVDHAEDVYVKQAEAVMKEYCDQPYKEEEAEEDLHLDYMKKRFGVKIDRGEHNIKK